MTQSPRADRVRLFVDVSETLAFDLRTGIQRVVRGLTREADVDGRFQIEPVIAVKRRFYRLSERGGAKLSDPGPEVLTQERSGRPTIQGTFAKIVLAPFPRLIRRLKRWRNATMLDPKLSGLWEGRPVAFAPGDRLVLADSYSLSGALFAGRVAKRQGAALIPLTYDLIPLKEEAQISESMVEHFRNTVLPAMEESDAVMTISDWCVGDLKKFGVAKPLGRFYLGYDLADASEGAALPDEGQWPEGLWDDTASVFLMIGTLTRHKGYHIAIDAFERLWREGSQARLLVIGRRGWDEELMARYHDNPELGRRLFVMHGASDDLLDKALRRATAVIQGSAIEGFGLPVIEALSRDIPVIASDIPVFREVAGDAALFYPQSDSGALANAVRQMQREHSYWVGCATRFAWLSWSEARKRFAVEVDRLARAAEK